MSNQIQKRKIRHRRVRAKISGTKERPRLSVFRSSKHLCIQLIDDSAGRTILDANTLAVKKGSKTERAKNLGKVLAKKMVAAGVKKVVFDRAGYKYHGRLKALAEALRKGGLEF